jgi:hypothetical protein
MDNRREKLRKVIKQSKSLQHLTEADIAAATPLRKPFIGKVGFKLPTGEEITTGFNFIGISWDVDSGAGSDWT